MRRIEPGDLIGSRLVWALDLHYGGTTYRIASEPIDVPASDGTMHSYTGGFEPVAIEETLGRLKFSAPQLRATVRAVLPVAAADLNARGYDWIGATADLFLTYTDAAGGRLSVAVSALDHRSMWHQISGPIDSPTWGSPGDPAGLVEFGLESAPWSATDPAINTLGTINSTTFPGADADAMGKRYPLVIGSPGVYLDSTGAQQTGAGSPAYVVGRASIIAETLLAAGHPCTGSSLVSAIDDGGHAYVAVASPTLDGEGNMVTTVDVRGAPATWRSVGQEFYICWDGAGGISGDSVAGVTEEAPDVAVMMLARAGLAVDYPAWAALKGRIPSVKVAGYVNDDSSAWEYLSRHVLPVMPVAYKYTRQGIAPVVYASTLRNANTVAHVGTVGTPTATGGGDWTPVGPIALETEPGDVPARIDVTMASDARTGEPPRAFSWVGTGAGDVRRYRGSVVRATDRGNVYLQQASTRGAVSTKRLTFAQVWDTPSIDAAASWRTKIDAMPTLSAAYSAPLHWGWLQIGDQITITDRLRAFDAAIVMIESRTFEDGGWTFTVLRDEDPVRDPRAID